MAEETKTSSVSFASGRKFVQSIRHQGLTTEEAVKELIDNSIDAEAENIWIKVWEDEKGVNISVQDDGRGMDPERLQRSVAFGETDNDGDYKRIGRFGFGLPTAITSRTKYAEVYSKQKGMPYYQTVVDLNALEKDSLMRLPLAVESDLKTKYGTIFEDVSSGSTVIFWACDKLDVKKPKTIEEHLLEDLEVTYREFLSSGKRFFLNGTPLVVTDPLMIIKGHKYASDLRKGLKKEDLTEETGYSQLFDIEPIPIEYEDENGKKGIGNIRVKLVMLPISDIHRTGGSKKYGASIKNSGFYVIRNGRQIAGGLHMLGIEPHNDYNYVRGQIDFDSCLDTEAGIQVNKSRFTLSTSMKAKILSQVAPLIKQISKTAVMINAELRGKADKEKNGDAESIISANPVRNPKPIRQATEEDVQNAIKEEIKEIENDTSLSDGEKEERKEQIRTILEKGMPFTIESARNKRGPIFSWEYMGKTTKITLNTEHPFFQYYWLPTQKDAYLRTMMKILIFTLAKAEQLQDEEKDLGHDMSYEELHDQWNMMLRTFLGSKEFTDFFKEVGPKATLEEEIGGAD